MPTVERFKENYYKKLDSIDLDILISRVIKKEREFILIHPEYKLTTLQAKKIALLANRRLKNEPLAYILGEKEFYGLNFKVNAHTLIPRPETELMVDLALQNVISHQSSVINVIDVGTGSGNIIISLTHNMEHRTWGIDSVNCESKTTNHAENCGLKTVNCFATDISPDALKIARQNARLHNLNKKIKFLHGDLLEPFSKKIQTTCYKLPATNLIILANLPYLSKDIYYACAKNVKEYEPKSALYSPQNGLSHYNKLLSQIKSLITSYKLRATILMEISPEQKKIIIPLIKKYFSQAQIKFKKDLAQKWRVCKIEIEE
ncbi:MAG: peptide chain release factor N(5)-glutamine methyltransferase [Parcubacteria group bacterium]